MTAFVTMFDGVDDDRTAGKKRRGKRNSSDSEAVAGIIASASEVLSTRRAVRSAMGKKGRARMTSGETEHGLTMLTSQGDTPSHASLLSHVASIDRLHRNDADLPPEVEIGNVEYKLKLVAPSASRLQHLVTQLKWRLREGEGEAIYEIGVEDSGICAGLDDVEMAASMATLRRMADALSASITVLRERCVADDRQVAEVLIRCVPDAQQFLDVRVAVLGCADAGKSTLLGVLTRGELDDGRGRARLNMFRHLHEVQSGRTSSITLECVGFDSEGKVVNHLGNSIDEICEKSTKLVTLIDLAGHQKYMKTTVFGLTGYQPHCAMLCVAANMGIVGTTREHLGLALALGMPVCVLITKCDAADDEQLEKVTRSVELLLKGPGCKKVPTRVASDDDVISVAASFDKSCVVPIFVVSAVSGTGLQLLEQFMNVLPPTMHKTQRLGDALAASATHVGDGDEFHVDEVFNVRNVGCVTAGLVARGCVRERDRLLCGPDDNGVFRAVRVTSMHRNKTSCRLVHAGQAASLAVTCLNDEEDDTETTTMTAVRESASAPILIEVPLRRHDADSPMQCGSHTSIQERKAGAWIRKGMVLVSRCMAPRASYAFRASIYVLYHPASTLCVGFQATVHIGHVCQTARIVHMTAECLHTTDTAVVTFVWCQRPEYLTSGARLLLREGKTKAIGQITEVCVDPARFSRSPSQRSLKPTACSPLNQPSL